MDVYMKKIIRLLSLIIALLMLGTCLAACGGNEDENPDTPPANTTVDENAETLEGKLGKDLDFKGETIDFVICGGDMEAGECGMQSRSIVPFGDEDLSFAVNSATLDRNATVEKELNVKINLKNVLPMQSLPEHLTPILSARMHEYDVVGAYQYFDIGLTIGETIGSFLNYETMDPASNYIDLEADYWDKDLYNTLKYKDVAFWVTGDLSQNWVGCITVSFVNKTLWEQYSDVIAAIPASQGITDLYELVEKKLWTIDLISAISKEIWVDKNSNEKVDYGDVVGFISYETSLNTIMTDVLAAGANISYSKLDGNGVPEISFYNSRTQLFATKLTKLYMESNALIVKWDNEKYIVEMFAEGNILFTPNYLYQAEHCLTEMTDTYIVLPPPLLVAGESYSTCLGDSVSQYGIPTTILKEGNLAATTATLEALAFYSHKMVTPVYYDQMLKGRYTHVESGDKQPAMIDMIRDARFSDFAMVWSNQLGNVTWFFRQNCQNRRLTENVSASEGTWKNNMTKLLEQIESSIWMEG